MNRRSFIKSISLAAASVCLVKTRVVNISGAGTPLNEGEIPLKSGNVKIIVDGNAGTWPIHIASNGKGYLIQREVQVDLPREVFNVLDNTTMTKLKKDNLTGEISESIVHTYPFRIISKG